MNQRGFFTVLGICFLLMATICIKTIQESGKIYTYDAISFQSEKELQNIADSALIEAAEKVRRNPELLPMSSPYNNASFYQYPIPLTISKQSARLENLSVEVYGERGNIYQGRKNFSSGGKPEILLDKDADDKEIFSEGVVLISVASCDGKILGGKMYRRSFAYFFVGEETIYYINDD